jgi:hypothetical protein
MKEKHSDLKLQGSASSEESLRKNSKSSVIEENSVRGTVRQLAKTKEM